MTIGRNGRAAAQGAAGIQESPPRAGRDRNDGSDARARRSASGRAVQGPGRGARSFELLVGTSSAEIRLKKRVELR